ncbi:N5-glutamine S-adenosyl-L-methionine-dependent methyltransferase [Tersicoccus solisilvae]|uniref:N5-glutamine S-adenosyl-L-methionine-dependent methyltransferase n=1 Tax=Tersicoccus solisilvae TaxID=1882339 RepID=A0ABQ1P6Z8_9MICC|nr:putative protein N(5)-glutamine methyltransferase [Tersicoccus solisilvae]GGC92249.1 N5-glutamine S-adenosyl-L-methionine-dependent methyltransferase [Tersicoccus solisilvae]
MSTTTPAGLREEAAARLRRAGCVFAEEEADLLLAAAPDEPTRQELIARRVAGEPLEHLLGWAAFGPLRVAVQPGVFVPRRRTLLLARLAASALDRRRRHPRPPAARDSRDTSDAREQVPADGTGAPVTVLELCCGAAAVTAWLARHVAAGSGPDAPRTRLIAADIDPVAVACARVNAPGALVLQGDLFAPLPADLAGTLDVVVANAPYVPTDAIGTMPPEARDHEHRVALDGGADGLHVQRRIAADIGRWLAPGGSVIVETSTRQAPASAGLFRDAGLRTRVVRDTRTDGTAVVARAA